MDLPGRCAEWALVCEVLEVRPAGLDHHAPLIPQLVQVEPDGPQPRVEVLGGVLPCEVALETETQTELAGDPPARPGVVERLDGRLTERDVRRLVGDRPQIVVSLEIGGLGQDDVGPVDVVLRQNVDRHDEVEGA